MSKAPPPQRSSEEQSFTNLEDHGKDNFSDEAEVKSVTGDVEENDKNESPTQNVQKRQKRALSMLKREQPPNRLLTRRQTLTMDYRPAGYELKKPMNTRSTQST